jgi:hypothetical protein
MGRRRVKARLLLIYNLYRRWESIELPVIQIQLLECTGIKKYPDINYLLTSLIYTDIFNAKAC